MLLGWRGGEFGGDGAGREEGGEAGGARGRGGVEVEEGADVGFVGAGDGVAFVDEGEEEGFAGRAGRWGGDGEEGDGRGAEGDAVHALEACVQVVVVSGFAVEGWGWGRGERTACENVEFGFDFFG